jgi:HK97 family phage major capsid protein
MAQTLVELFEKVGVKLNTGESKVQKNDILQDVANGDVQVETNANEVMHTTNTNVGKELVPVNILAQQVMDVIPQYATFLGNLPGNHGTGLNVSEKVSVIGDAGFFKGNTEWTTGAGTIAQGNTKPPTDEMTLTQYPFIMSVDISKRELNYAVGDLQNLIVNKVARAWARTAEALIINGDNETSATGNVSLYDAAPASTIYFLQNDHGIRELSLNGSACTVNAGTLDIGDFTSVENILGDYMASPQDCMWIFNRATYNKALGLQAFYDAAQRGAQSTLDGKAITNIHGADVFIARDMPKTLASGMTSTTAASNTFGQFALVWKPAIQIGYGQPIEFDVVKVPGKGISVIATVEFGFVIAQKLASVTDSSVAVAYNVTIT